MSESQQLPNGTNISDPNASPSRIEVDLADNQPNPSSEEENKLAVWQAEDGSSEIAEALAWQSDADVAELVALSEALRQQNTDLMEHVQELETLLEECHSALQLQVKRSQNTEAQLAQQNKELQATQEQLTRLFRELEASHQVAQRQQILTETLTDQLQSSQERVAQLERQCASIQQRYNEQTQLLLQSETACSELQDRLQRQQRYTLQFKAALDKCLEMPATKEATNNIITPVTPTGASDLTRFSVKPQPIQPWSAKSDSASSDTEDRPVVTENYGEAEYTGPEKAENLAENNFINPFSGATEPEVMADREPGDDIKGTEEVLWAELERLTKEAVSPNPIAKELSTSIDSENNIILQISEPIEQIAKTEELAAHEEERSVAQAVPEESDLVTANAVASQPRNWPSPVVYPQRTPKKIKSLAAIDLPSFPRLNQK